MIEYLKICNFTETKAGGTPSTKVKEYWENGDIPWLNSGALNQGIVKTTSKYITKLGLDNSSTKLMPPDTILIALTGATTGITGYLTFEACANQSVVGILPSKRHFPKYLYYYLILIRQKVLKDASGAAQPGVNQKYVKNIQIPIPPIDEQKRIVAKLDECFEAIDKARANVEKNLNNAKELFQSQLNQSFSQRGEVWVDKKLGEVCENLDSRRIPITKNKRVSGDIPYYGASGIVDYVADFIFDEDLLLVSEDGANLLARVYPIAFSISGKTWINNHAHVLKFEEFVSQSFMEYYLNSIKLDDYVSGMAQPKLNQKMLNSIPVPYPSLKTQSETVTQLDALREQTQSLESNYQQELNALDELKKSILQKAFNGEL
jgi:type I restriction enzyme S subunit|tara:strand:+ start:372 stop:1499 length:1128 start_codon:yes stop_codon:yes gene_type:complete